MFCRSCTKIDTLTLKTQFAYALQAAKKQPSSPVPEPQQQETNNEEEQSQARAAAKRAKKLRQKAKKKEMQSLAPNCLPNTSMPKDFNPSVDAQTSACVPVSFPETLRTSCCLREFFSLVVSLSKKSKDCRSAADDLSKKHVHGHYKLANLFLPHTRKQPELCLNAICL